MSHQTWVRVYFTLSIVAFLLIAIIECNISNFRYNNTEFYVSVGNNFVKFIKRLCFGTFISMFVHEVVNYDLFEYRRIIMYFGTGGLCMIPIITRSNLDLVNMYALVERAQYFIVIPLGLVVAFCSLLPNHFNCIIGLVILVGLLITEILDSLHGLVDIPVIYYATIRTFCILLLLNALWSSLLFFLNNECCRGAIIAPVGSMGKNLVHINDAQHRMISMVTINSIVIIYLESYIIYTGGYWYRDRGSVYIFSTYVCYFLILFFFIKSQSYGALYRRRILEHQLHAKRSVIKHVSNVMLGPLSVLQSGFKNVICALTECLQKCELRQSDGLPQQPYVEQIPDMIQTVLVLRGSCDVAVDIIDDLICFEDTDVVTNSLDSRELVRVRCLLEDVVKFQHPFIDEKSLSIHIRQEGQHASFPHPPSSLPPSLPLPLSESLCVHVIRSKMMLALKNILSNAIKYSKRHDLIDVVVKHHTDDCTVSISIIDYGLGLTVSQNQLLQEIARDHLNTIRIPSAYYAHATTGVGLLSARNIIHKHLGTISIQSDGVGCGTVVTVVLPVVTPCIPTKSIKNIDK